MDNLINKYVNYIIEEYIKAGGKEADVDRNMTYWTLRGIYDREGKDALDKFVKDWKPNIVVQEYRGYC